MTQEERRKWLRAIVNGLNDIRGDGGVSLLSRLIHRHESNIQRRLRGDAGITDSDLSLISLTVRDHHEKQIARHKAALRRVKG